MDQYIILKRAIKKKTFIYILCTISIIYMLYIINVHLFNGQQMTSYFSISLQSPYVIREPKYFSNAYKIIASNSTMRNSTNSTPKSVMATTASPGRRSNVTGTPVVKTAQDILNELSELMYKNIATDIHTIEKTMHRTPTQEEYVALKNKYFNEEYFRSGPCRADIGDLLSEPNIQPIDDQKCNPPLITINFSGRTGNKVCQYLSLFILHTMYNASIAIYPEMNTRIADIFESGSIPIIPIKCDNKLRRQHYTYESFHKKMLSDGFNEPYEPAFSFGDIFIENNPCPIHMLMSRRKMLKKELKLLPSLITEARSRFDNLIPRGTPTNSTLISVHVRRTDYQSYSRGHFQQLVSIDYYRRAMSFFRNTSRFENVLFMVFSDDLQWCRKNFIANDIVFSGNADQKHPFSDFAMISECDHHIIGYGTFSFTAALLSDGFIVYPLPAVPRKMAFGTQRGCMCSDSNNMIPIPDVPLSFTMG